MNLKKIFKLVLLIFIGLLVGFFLLEVLLQTIPFIAKNVPENSKIQYVYVLGESSSCGIPYQGKISFGKIIQYITSNKIDNKDIKLINLSVPGHKLIHQYLKYFTYRYTHPFDKGIILLYVGTNDLTYNHPEKYFYIFYRSNLLKIMSAYSNKFEDFYYRYENIIKLAKMFGDDIYISTIAGNYADFSPDNMQQDKISRDTLIYIDDLFFQGNYNKAFSFCLNNINKYNKSHIFYRIGKIYENFGKIKESNDFYIKSVDIKHSDRLRPRPGVHQNEMIKFLACKHNIPLLDIFKKLYDSGEIIGSNFFIDKIHPSLRLNLMIADGFVDLISEKYKLNRVDSVLNEEKIKEIFNFTDTDLFFSYIQALGETIRCSYISKIPDRYALHKIQNDIILIKQLNLQQDKIDEQKKTIEFLEAIFEYISNENSKNKFKDKIKLIYYYGLDKNYFYSNDFNFNELLKENNII